MQNDKFSISFNKWLYVVIVVQTILLTLLLYPFKSFLGLGNIALIYLLPVLFFSATWGMGPALVSALINVLAFDFFYVPPKFSISVEDFRYLISFVIFILVGFITGSLSNRLKNQVIVSKQREENISALYALSKDIAAVTELDSVLKSVVQNVADTVKGNVQVFMPDEYGKMELRASSSQNKYCYNEYELEAVNETFKSGTMAGKGTHAFEMATGVYLPLYSEQKIQGVLGVQSNNTDFSLQHEQLKLLEAFASFSAMAINRAKLTEQAREANNLIESERLRTALFNSLSHDLRTPLASIIGAVTGLLEGENIYSREARQDLLLAIQHGATRMHRFINNLLDMARLESGMLKLKKDWCDVQDIVGVVISQFGETLSRRNLKVSIEQNLPFVMGDFILLEQVFINILDNALKYSEPGSEITISVCKIENHVQVSIADVGPPIPDSDIGKIFDKFYRLTSPLQVSGTGLGLAICKGIVEAHGGNIWAENNPSGGVIISFKLPESKDVNNAMLIANEGEIDG